MPSLPFQSVDLGRDASPPPRDFGISTCRRENSGVSFKPFAPLDTPGRWQNELACVVLHIFSNPLFSFNEAVLDK